MENYEKCREIMNYYGKCREIMDNYGKCRGIMENYGNNGKFWKMYVKLWKM